MTELTDASGAFSYGDSILVGERVRLRGVRDDDLPTLAKREMDPRAHGHAVVLARRALVRRGADVHPRPRVGSPPIVPPMS